jgi:hypothetical protein
MNYKEIIKKLNPIFEINGFEIDESLRNFTKYQSEFVTINISFDEKEKSLSIFIGKKNGFLSELTDKTYIDFFGESSQSINGNDFSEKFIHFLAGKGNALLEGNLKILDALELYSFNEAKVYTTSLMNRQYINDADNAWNKNNFSDFLKFINCVNENDLSKSYILKKEFALSKIINPD